MRREAFVLTLRSRCCNNSTSEGRPFQVMGTAELKSSWSFFALYLCTHLEQRERKKERERERERVREREREREEEEEFITSGNWRGKRNAQDGVEPTHLGQRARHTLRDRETLGLHMWVSEMRACARAREHLWAMPGIRTSRREREDYNMGGSQL
jgi:hypothetical protein